MVQAYGAGPLLAGHIDIAWNTPLAHVRVKERTNGSTCVDYDHSSVSS